MKLRLIVLFSICLISDGLHAAHLSRCVRTVTAANRTFVPNPYTIYTRTTTGYSHRTKGKRPSSRPCEVELASTVLNFDIAILKLIKACQVATKNLTKNLFEQTPTPCHEAIFSAQKATEEARLATEDLTKAYHNAMEATANIIAAANIITATQQSEDPSDAAKKLKK